MDKRKLLLVFVCVAMVLPLVGALLYFVILKGTIAARIVYGLAKLSMLAGPIVVVITLEKNVLRFASFDWKNLLRAISLGLLTGGCIAAFMLVLYEYSALGDYVNRFAGDVRQKAEQLGFLDHYWSFGVFLAVGHSLLEEYYWRWFVFGRLRKFLKSAVSAALLGSLTFAAHHYVVLGCFFSLAGAVLLGTSVAMGGCLWCWMYNRQKTLIGCWLSHALIDMMIMYIGYRLIFT
ncbi:MAG: CPBP family intramembrane metalloprotease [Sedimentisphaerales bacterium]|nr:CPBP family intramembrane metalloprotease [Sedimentisphaerales bacterium]